MKVIQWAGVVVLVSLLGACAASQPADLRGILFPVLDASYLNTEDFIDLGSATGRVALGINRDQARLLL
ncbi:MAG: hypothetical protein P1U47_09630 [Zhongshania sp.]|uniref:hypothetical protein n=1 Tax=Zhongshania sp. TaxID=1971902 RepID=UPI00260DCF5D|nr:hypothetical protein [Zhongshania sp.]MDF1692622.1 hypothetical protein [Zhongshania sp.]